MIKHKFNNKIIKAVFLAISLSSIFSFSSCTKSEKNLKAASTLSDKKNSTEKVPAKLKKISAETKAYIEGKNVLVILGYGYNSEESITRVTQFLNDNYGVETAEKPGLVSILVYPSDFMVAGKERISSLADRIEDKNLAGMIILGAPEGLHIALSKIQDKTEDGKIPYPVFTFFSQDDVLGTESTSDFVLDYAQKTNMLEAEVTDFIPDFDVNVILSNSISSIIELREPLKADKNLITYIQKLLDKKHIVSNYVDGETGLQSINHFIFE